MLRYFRNLSNIDDRVRTISWQTLNLTRTLTLTSLVSTNVTSALELFLNDMRYINPRFTYLLTY